MNQDASTPDEQRLYTLVRLYDEAVAHGASPEALEPSVAGLKRDEADQFADLRHCVELLEIVRHSRDAKAPMRAASDESDQGASLPERLGRFELHGEIGRGGCGVVFRAHDPAVGRDVAIKVPRPETLLIDEFRQRFLQEARVAGSLDHPNVVPIYEVGEDGPICFIAAAFIEGPSLAAWLGRQQRAIDVRQAAHLVATLADALDHAHDRGVIHRDMKPANVLLQPVVAGAEPTELSQYVPKVTDFGLAKLRESPGGGTRTGIVLGTPEYMAPEQAQGRLQEIGPATDVYALGAILYELLTGRPPLRGESEVDTVRRIVVDEPALVRLARPNVPRDIEAITMKCLEKRPAQRYETARELAADLHRFLSGDATRARPISQARRLERWLRRRPAVAALVAVSGLALATLFCGSLFYNARLSEALNTARTERRRAEAQSLTSRQLLYSAEVRLAYDAWHSSNRARTLELLERQIPASGQPDQREFAWHWLWGKCHGELLSLAGHTDEVFRVAYSPDGKMLATASKDGTARLWDATTGRQQHILDGHTSEVTCVQFSPDGKLLATGSEDHQVILWDPHSGERLFALAGHESHVLDVAFSSDGAQLASGGRDNCVRVWDLKTRVPLRVLDGPSQPVRAVRYAPNGQTLAACDEGGAVHRWNVADWRADRPLASSVNPLFGLEFSADSQRLLTAGRDSVIYCWDVQTKKQIGSTGEGSSENWIRDLRLSPDGKMFATSSQNGFVRLWRAPQPPEAMLHQEELIRMPAHVGRAWSVAWSPDGKQVATAGADRAVRIWRVADFLEPTPYPFTDGWVWGVALLEDGNTLLTAHQGGKLCQWNLKAHEIASQQRWAGPMSELSMAASGDGRYAVVASRQTGQLRFLDVETGKTLFQDDSYPNGVYAVDFSPDESLVAVASNDQRATILEVPSGLRRHDLRHAAEVDAVQFSPDGSRLVTCSRELRMWDVQSGRLLWSVRRHEADPRSAVFSPDGRLIAAAIGDTSVVLVDADGGEPRGTMLSDRGRAGHLAFSPDGRTLAVGASWSSAVTLWDVRTRQELCTFDGGLGALLAMAFSPDGTRLVAAGHFRGKQRTPYGTGQIVEWRISSAVGTERTSPGQGPRKSALGP